MMPEISVIIPVFNVEAYLPMCIESVLSQTFKNLEVILIDDGSTDTSGQICDNYAMRDSRIRVFHKKNEGQSIARNLGLEQSRGKYILYLDSDDCYIESDCIYKLFNVMEKDKYDFVLFCSVMGTSLEEAVNRYGEYDLDVFERNNRNEIFRYMIKENKQLACMWNKIISKKFLQENQIILQEDIIGEDIEWSIALFRQARKIGAINDVFHFYRQNNSTSLTSTNSREKTKGLYSIILKCTNRYGQNGETEFGSAVLSFMAFEYAILLHNIACFESINEFEEMKQEDWLLAKALDKKTKTVAVIYKILGFKSTINLMKLMRKIR